jgi:hypothetical protein
VSTPDTDPTAIGEKTTEIVQDADIASVEHVVDAIAKGPDTVGLIVSGAPALLTVTVVGGLVEPTSTEPKISDTWSTESADWVGAVPVPVSTATPPGPPAPAVNVAVNVPADVGAKVTSYTHWLV